MERGSLSGLLMASIQKAVKQADTISITEQNHRKLKWESEAIRVIKDKIKHYKKTGNQRKLTIYQSKLKGAYSIISRLTKL